MDGKITKVWFDEALGDIQQEDVAWRNVWLTAEELKARFNTTIPSREAFKPEIWGMDFAEPGGDRTVTLRVGSQVGKTLVMADIQRAIDSLQNDSPTHAPRYLTANLYDRAEALGYPLGGVMRLAPIYAVQQRPPAAAKSRAALHPLVGRLIDRFNKEK